MARCPSCGAETRHAAAYCRSCGAPLVASTWVCPDCGVAVKPGMRFCGHCGHPAVAIDASPGSAAPAGAVLLAQAATVAAASYSTPPQPVSATRVTASHAHRTDVGTWLVVLGGAVTGLGSIIAWGLPLRGAPFFSIEDYWTLSWFMRGALHSYRYVPLPLQQIAVILCLLAAALALIRAFGGGGPSPKVLMWFGIIAVAVLGGYDLIAWAFNYSRYGWYPGLGFALGVGGAILVIVGALRMPRPTSGNAGYGPGSAPAQGAPGIGVAGFVLSLLGFAVIGFVLSWVGLAQARREGRPTGLCVAGIVIGAVWTILLVAFVAFILVVASRVSVPTYMGE